MNDVLRGATLRQLVEWGYPQGARRATPDPDLAFSVIHITGNSRLPTAENEVGWRINDPENQNSATFFVNRDGSIVQALGDPLHMDPWSNGDVNHPDTSTWRIAKALRDGVNMNERTLVSIENVGYEPGHPITAAQERACAKIIAYYHKKAGVPIRRGTVVGHYQINSVDRPNCPGRNKSVIDRIVTKARALNAEPVAQEPEDDMILLPVEVFPADTKAVFAAGTEYDLYRVRDGQIERKKFTPDSRTTALAGARVVLNGDEAHPGVYLLDGHAGWIVSGWGSLPVIRKPRVIDAEAAVLAATEPLNEKIEGALPLVKQAVDILAN